jgi:predicted nucleic acid-binding protein
MRVFIDSGGFLAVMDRDDPHHPAARDISARLESIRSQPYTSNNVVDETCTLVRARTSHSLAAQFLRSLKTSRIIILRVSPAVEAEAERIFLRHADKDFSFTDCTSFALIETKRLDTVLSFDRHFSQYRFRRAVTILADPRDVR